MAKIPADVMIDIDDDNIRGRSFLPSKVSSRSTLVTSNASSIPYYEKMEINNDLLDKEVRDPVDSSQLLYKDDNEEGNPVRKAANNGPTRNLQCIQNKALVLKNSPKLWGKSTFPNNTNMSPLENIINIQLPYDLNQPTKLDLWDRTF